MERKPRKVKKVVQIMTNPTPEFVSLVGHPANQTPFRAVRLDQRMLESVAHTEAEQELVQRTGASEVGINKMLFDKKAFKSQDTVKSYMDGKGFSNYAVNDIGSSFEVPGSDASAFDGEIETISGDKGVTMYVGRVKKSVQAERKAATDAVNPGSISPERAKVQKYDGWLASYSDGKTIAEVMADGMWDGLPPGFWDVADAFMTALRTALIEKDEAAVRALGGEFMDVTLKLVKLFEGMAPEEVERFMTTKSATEPNKPAPPQTEAPKPPTPEAVTPPNPPVEAQTTDDEAAAKDGKDGKNPSEPEKPESTEPVQTTEVQKTGTEQSDDESVLSKALAGVGKVISEALAPIATRLDEISTKQTDLETKVSKSDERLEAIEAARGQTRKSAEIEDTAATATQESATRAKEQNERAVRRSERQIRNSLGL